MAFYRPTGLQGRQNRTSQGSAKLLAITRLGLRLNIGTIRPKRLRGMFGRFGGKKDKK